MLFLGKVCYATSNKVYINSIIKFFQKVELEVVF